MLRLLETEGALIRGGADIGLPEELREGEKELDDPLRDGAGIALGADRIEGAEPPPDDREMLPWDDPPLLLRLDELPLPRLDELPLLEPRESPHTAKVPTASKAAIKRVLKFLFFNMAHSSFWLLYHNTQGDKRQLSSQRQ